MPQRDDATTPRDPQQSIDEQRREIDRLREDLRRSEAERQRLRRENEKLKDELEAARRAVYRQAAPFSRGTQTSQRICLACSQVASANHFTAERAEDAEWC